MAFLRLAPFFWNPFMFLFPELYGSPGKPPRRDEIEEKK